MISVLAGVLDNTDDLAMGGQLFAQSHAEWGPLPVKTSNLDDALLVRFDAS